MKRLLLFVFVSILMSVSAVANYMGIKSETVMPYSLQCDKNLDIQTGALPLGNLLYYSLSAYIYNYGSEDFNGNIYLAFRNKDTAEISEKIMLLSNFTISPELGYMPAASPVTIPEIYNGEYDVLAISEDSNGNIYPISLSADARTFVATVSDGAINISESTPISGVNSTSISSDRLCVFPNPASSNISVANDANDVAKIIIYDIYGKKLIETSYAPRIDISALNAGHYFVQAIYTDGTIEASHLIKQ